MGVLMGRGTDRQWWASSQYVGHSSLSHIGIVSSSHVIVVCCCHMSSLLCVIVIAHHHHCTLSHSFIIACCWHDVVPHPCHVVVSWSPGHWPVLSSHVPSLWHVNQWWQMSLFIIWLSVRWVGMSLGCDSPDKNDEQQHWLLFVIWLSCHCQWCGTGFCMKHRWSVPSMNSRFHLWAIIFFNKQCFLFMGSCCQSQTVIFIHGQSFAFMDSCWQLWVVGFIVAHCWHCALCGGCCQQRLCVVIVVVDGRMEECHTLWH